MQRLFIKGIIKTFIGISLIVTMTASCGKIQENVASVSTARIVSPTPIIVSPEPTKSEINVEKPIQKFDDLISNEHISLDIEKKGQNRIYKASEMLNNTILSMLQKSEKITDDLIQASKFDYKKYDYILKFSGARDILLSLEDDTFHLDGDKQVYKLWGNSGIFWNSLLQDNANNLMDLPAKPVPNMVQEYKLDIDGDGTRDDVRLAFYKSKTIDSNGQLKLMVDSSEIVVEKEIGWVTEPFNTINEPPSLKFIPQKKGNALIVSYSWVTNGIGLTGEISAFEYNKGRFKDINVNLPDMSFSYLKDGNVNVYFKQLNKSQKIKPSISEVKSIIQDSGHSINDVLKNKLGFYPHTFQYIIKDFDGDGKDELCSENLLRFQIPPRLSLGFLFTIYKLEDGKFIPKKIILEPPYDETNIIRIIKGDLIETVIGNGYIDLNKTEDKKSWSQLEKQYGSKDFYSALNELIQDKSLKKTGNKIFIGN